MKKEKGKRLAGWILAWMVVFTQMFAGGAKLPVEAAENTEIPIANGDFAEDLWGNNAGWSTSSTEWGSGGNNSTTLSTTSDNHVGELNFWGQQNDVVFDLRQQVTLEAGTYQLSVDVKDGTGAEISFIFGEQTGGAKDIGSIDKTSSYQSEFTLAAAGTVDIGLRIAVTTAGGWGQIDNFVLKKAEQQEPEEGYKITITPGQDSVEVGNPITLTAKVTNNGTEITDLAEAGLHLYWWDNTNDSGDWFVDYDGTNGYSLTLNINPQKAGTFEIQAKLQDSSWKDLVIQKCNIQVTAPSTAIQGELNVTRVDNLSEDFIMGMDISSVISLFDSGVTYKDWNGKTISNVTDFCKFLASNGINHIRVRIWNNPYDANGNGYGGGNNDVAKAKQIADACEAAGIHMLADFHCSDLWTDPGKQQVPKAWAGYTLDEKKEALQEFISTSLNTIDPNKNTVDMVQVGNETTGGFIGEDNIANMCTLFSAGSAGVKAFNSSTKVVIHVESPNKGSVTKWAKNLNDNNVNYDIIATSYYPYWHGTLANLKSEFQKVKSTYGKEVMVAETSYAYTLIDSDGHDNTVRVGNNDDSSQTYCTEPFTVQGQATSIRNLINTVNEAGGLGVFYWEPAWLTVGDTRGLTGTELENRKAANRQKWETYGSGWASSYAGEYDAKDAGKWYGGSAVDNEAMFYPDGTPTAGLYVWEYVKTGAVSNVISVDGITNPSGTVYEGENCTLPDTVSVSYNTGNVDESVTWAAQALEKIDTKAAGTTYIVSGTVHFSKEVTSGQYKGKTSAPVTYTLKVNPKNLITDADDAGFEKGNNFTVAGDGMKPVPSNENPYAGSGSASWWNASTEAEAEGMVTYNPVITLEAGEYVLEAVAQGEAGDMAGVQILDAEEHVLHEGSAVLDGWKNWKTPMASFTLSEKTDVKVRVTVKMKASGWGSVDELFLHKTAEEKVVYINENTTPESPSDNPGSSSGSSSSGSSSWPSSGAISGPSSGSSSETPSGPSSGDTGNGSTGEEQPVIIENPDGTTTAVTNTAAANSAGKKVEKTTKVTSDKNGTVVRTEEVSVIDNPAKNTSATVTVRKNADGSIDAATADVTKTGSVEKKGTKVTVSAAVTAQIKEAAGTDDVVITTTVTDKNKTVKYNVSVNAKNLVTGKKLQVVAADKKTGKYVLVNAKTYTVTEKGNVTVTLPNGKDYVLVSDKEAKAVSNAVLKTVKVKSSSKTVKAGKKTSIQLGSGLNMDNVQKITYTTSNRKKATVNKNGKVTTKAKGTVNIKAKVTLKNGKTKTVTMKIKIR